MGAVLERRGQGGAGGDKEEGDDWPPEHCAVIDRHESGRDAGYERDQDGRQPDQADENKLAPGFLPVLVEQIGLHWCKCAGIAGIEEPEQDEDLSPMRVKIDREAKVAEPVHDRHDDEEFQGAANLPISSSILSMRRRKSSRNLIPSPDLARESAANTPKMIPTIRRSLVMFMPDQPLLLDK